MRGLEMSIPKWEISNMAVTADSKRRVLLQSISPGDRFDVHMDENGRLILTRLEPVDTTQPGMEIRKVDGYSVGVLNTPIDKQALDEALAEFP